MSKMLFRGSCEILVSYSIFSCLIYLRLYKLLVVVYQYIFMILCIITSINLTFVYIFACVASSTLPTTLLNHWIYKCPVWYFSPTWTLCTTNFLHSFDLSILMILYIIVWFELITNKIWLLTCTINFSALLETYFSHSSCTKIHQQMENRTHQAS